MTTNTEIFRAITKEMADTYECKNVDYGNSFGISVSKYGLIAALTRISDKFNRIEHIITHSVDDLEVPNETLADTLLDLACYAIMTRMQLPPSDPGKCEINLYEVINNGQ